MRHLSGVLVFLFLALQLVSAQPVSAQHLQLLTEEKPPMNFRDPETHEVTGITTTLLKAIIEDAGMTAEFSLMPWKRAYRRALDEANTCVFTTVRTPEREPSFKWVSPLFQSGWAFYRPKGSNLVIKSEADLSGKVVVMTSGTREISGVNGMEGLYLLEVPSEMKALALLYEGRADLWVSGVFTAFSGAEAAQVAPPELAFLWRPMELGMACSQVTSDEIIARLNAANLKQESLKAALKQQYYYFSKHAGN